MRHPALPHAAIINAYFKNYIESNPRLVTAGWRFTMETAAAGSHIVLSSVLDKYPGAKIILSHLGEALPFFIVPQSGEAVGRVAQPL